MEVDDKIQTHPLYRDLANSAVAFGAERWLMELQRMCERFGCATDEYIPIYDSGGEEYSDPFCVHVYLLLLYCIKKIRI